MCVQVGIELEWKEGLLTSELLMLANRGVYAAHKTKHC